MKPLEHMSKRDRMRTPAAFARWLVSRVREIYSCERVAVLWVCQGSAYYTLGCQADCWDIMRDANRYEGPYPVVAHPPCGPWGNYKARRRQSKAHGIRAMQLVHAFGGVVEQPKGSCLFRLHGNRGLVQSVNQCDYGHAALKPTILYWC